MTKEELQIKIIECRELNEKFETVYSTTITANTELQKWLTAIEMDLADRVIPEKIMEK